MAESRNLTTLIMRLIVQTDQMSTDLKRASGEVSTWEKKTKSAASNVAKYFAGAFTVFAAVGALRKATQDAREFGKAVAEVSTLLPKDTDMAPIREGAKELSKQFGTSAQEQAKAYYQIISAGAAGAAEATDILTASNKLAVGGVTDVFNAADGLTSVLNAYGLEASDATDVSDAMFVAMRAGKTTIGELSQNIGQVATIAAQTGVAFEDLLAATAALTKGGVDTAQAMTQIRSVLVAVLKQEKEAVQYARQLGIDFSVSALQAKGFAGFIAEVAEKTGGSAEALATLFGRVEGLSGVLALGGKAAGDYAAILDQMKVRAGETEEAFRKMSEESDFKMKRLKASIEVLAIGVGDKFLNVIVPAVEKLVDNFDAVVKSASALATFIVTKVVTALAVKYVGAMIASVVATRAAIAENLRYQATLAQMAVFNGIATTSTVGLTGALITLRGAISGIFVALGGWVGLITTGISLLAAAWVAFGGSAEDAGDQADGALKRQLDTLNKTILAHEKAKESTKDKVKAIDEEIASLKKATAELEKQRTKTDDATGAAESLAASLGDYGALSRQDAIGQQIERNRQKTEELVKERENLTGAKILNGETEWQKTLQESINKLKTQNEELEKRLAKTKGVAKPTEEVSVPVGGELLLTYDVEVDPKRLQEQIETNKALIKGQTDALVEELGKQSAIVDDVLEETTKKGPIGIVPPEVLQAKLKTQQKILELMSAEQVAILEDSYQRGIISAEDYYQKRITLLETNTRREIAALQEEKKATSTTDVRKEEIRAEIVQKEIVLRREKAKVILEEFDAAKKYNQAVLQGDVQAILAENKLQLTEINQEYENGKLTVEEYYSEKKRLAEEAAQAEILSLTEQLGYTQDIIEQQNILGQIAAKEAAVKLSIAIDKDSEEKATKEVLDTARQIGQEYLSVRAETAMEMEEYLRLQQEGELRALEDRYNREIEMVEDHKDYLVELDGVYYEKSYALQLLAEEREEALRKKKLLQAQEIQRAKLSASQKIFGDWSNAMGAMFEATGGKLKVFFLLQKAFSVAEATVKTYQAVQDAYAWGMSVGGLPVAIITAAAALTFGLAQVANIAKQKMPEAKKEGGPITGGSGTKDDVPILAMAGEYMVKKRAVEHYGVQAIEAINRMIVPKSFFDRVGPLSISAPEVRFQEGGIVTAPAIATGGEPAGPRLTQLLLDGRVIGEWFMDEVSYGRIKLIPR